MNRKLMMAIIAFCVTALQTGCASIRLVAREINPDEEEKFVERCGWNLLSDDETMEFRVGERGTIGAIKIRNNYFYALCTVLSFGHWIPFDITYEVNK